MSSCSWSFCSCCASVLLSKSTSRRCYCLNLLPGVSSNVPRVPGTWLSTVPGTVPRLHVNTVWASRYDVLFLTSSFVMSIFSTLSTVRSYLVHLLPDNRLGSSSLRYNTLLLYGVPANLSTYALSNKMFLFSQLFWYVHFSYCTY